MEEELKKISNKDLMQIYHLIMEHLKYLNECKTKIEEDDKK